jgi:hypothetical protein
VISFILDSGIQLEKVSSDGLHKYYSKIKLLQVILLTTKPGFYNQKQYSSRNSNICYVLERID